VKLFTGLLGAWAFVLMAYEHGKSDKVCHELGKDGCAMKAGADNILNYLGKGWMPEITIYSSFLFNLLTLIPGIPIISIIVRYNLLAANLCGPMVSFGFAVVLPWVITMFTYRLSLLGDICSWAGIVVMGFANFVVPAMIYREALLRYPLPGEASYTEPLLLEEDGGCGGEEEDEPEKQPQPASPPVDAIPPFVRRLVAPARLAKAFAVVFTVVSLVTIALNVYLEVIFHSSE
jgi:hypothetical protein